jgi:protein MAK11
MEGQPAQHRDKSIVLQVVTGSYERELHGITITIPGSLLAYGPTNDKKPPKHAPPATFESAFLFKAHTSAIRSLAISPPSSSHNPKRILATGGSDAEINLYHLSTSPPPSASHSTHGLLPNLASNTRNKSLGTLTTHDAAITALSFPHSSRSPLLSVCSGNILALTHTRTWTTLSLLKAPTPKALGRPSGDTSSATSNTYPQGVNAIAIHPSNKLLLSVHHGEKCLRLWNLLSGKKAGVFAFDKELLKNVGEATENGRIGWGKGEGRTVVWHDSGSEFAVGFERAVAVFNADCTVQSIIRPEPDTKIHCIKYIHQKPREEGSILAVSTESGEVQFYSTTTDFTHLLCTLQPPAGNLTTSRIKAFDIIDDYLVITAASDGVIRVWKIDIPLVGNIAKDDKPWDIALLLGSFETGSRILCMGSFLLDGVENDLGAPVNGLKDGDGESSDGGESRDLEDDAANEEDENSDNKDGVKETNEDNCNDDEEFNGLDD